MHHEYDFLVVGGGMVADAAAKGIREQGATGTIGIVGDELTEPFPRPALSNKLWTDPDFTYADAALHTERLTGASLHLGDPAVSVDPDQRCVATRGGHRYDYGRLLVATGCSPRRLPGLDPGDRVVYFRTLVDYHRMRGLAAQRPRVVVVGGGFLGPEMAAALVEHQCEVVLVHPYPVLGARRFPESVATCFEQLFTDAGVDVVGNHRVTGGRSTPGRVTLDLDDGTHLDADVAVVAVGAQPATDMVKGVVELDHDGAVVVDEGLATSAPDVYAAGDLASYPDRILGRTRVTHVDNAEHMGASAGRIMAGSEETYAHTPMYYSDVLDHGYEAVGRLDASMETLVDDAPDEGKVVYYLDDERVRGVLLWNHEGGLDLARDVLARPHRPHDVRDLVGTIR